MPRNITTDNLPKVRKKPYWRVRREPDGTPIRGKPGKPLKEKAYRAYIQCPGEKAICLGEYGTPEAEERRVKAQWLAHGTAETARRRRGIEDYTVAEVAEAFLKEKGTVRGVPGVHWPIDTGAIRLLSGG